MNRDPFRPFNEPARTIYDAFQAEAAKRSTRTVEEWMEREVDAVWRAAVDYARQNGRRAPDLEEVQAAERHASGSADYGAQWAYALARKMSREKAQDGVSAQRS